MRRSPLLATAEAEAEERLRGGEERLLCHVGARWTHRGSGELRMSGWGSQIQSNLTSAISRN